VLDGRHRLFDAVPQQPAVDCQLVTKPSIIPICIRNQWLELSIGAFQITY
jgi:hypothetical protein